jgi:sugar phosphate isomerase/epimerase
VNRHPGPELRLDPHVLDWAPAIQNLKSNIQNPTFRAMSTSSMRIANAPCSWGVLEFNLPGRALSYAQVLDEISATGYAGTELGDWGFIPSDPAALRAELKARSLELRATQYEGWIVVEQDVLPGMGEPKEYARRNREFLKSCGL